MYHYFNTFTNTSGDSLAGYRVRLTDLSGNAVTIYADENETPISSVSGVANAAVTDADGNYSIFVEPGTYNLNFSDANDALVKAVRYVPMLNGPQGETGPQGPVGSVNAAEKLTISTTQPATPSTGTSQTLVEFTTPTNPAGQPSPAKVRFSATHSPYAANSQGWTHPAYTNKTVGFSVGATATYGKEISTEAAASMIIEHGFIVQSANDASNVKGVEFHWQMVGSDYAGYRPITAFAPWEAADTEYDASISFQGALLDFKSGSGTSIISWNFRGALSDPKIVSLNSKVDFRHEGNNYPWLKQNNVAGNAQINLPWVDNTNAYAFSRNVYMSTNTVLTNGLGIQSLMTMVANDSITSGARLVYLNTNAVTGNVVGYEGELSASTYFEGVKVRNTHASGSSGIKVQGNGVCYIDLYNEASFLRWGMRLTATDFVIGQQENGTSVSDALSINFTTLQTSFVKPPKLPSATVSGAGSASTFAAGSLHYVIDLNSTTAGSTAAGGGSNKGVIVSDGTNWKIMVAWA